MKKVPLTQGKFALVDDRDFGRVSKLKWCVQRVRNNIYAVSGRNYSHTYLHRFLIPDAVEVHHKNGDGLDCRRKNLCPATHAQNLQAFRRRPKGASSKFRGVRWHKGAEKWSARITINYRETYLGLFESEVDAAKAYDKAAREKFGDFAYPNFP